MDIRHFYALHDLHLYVRRNSSHLQSNPMDIRHQLYGLQNPRLSEDYSSYHLRSNLKGIRRHFSQLVVVAQLKQVQRTQIHKP